MEEASKTKVKTMEFEKAFEGIKCSVPTCRNDAVIFIIIKMLDRESLNPKLNKTAICPDHLLSSLENWIPSIKKKHRKEGIKNLSIYQK